MKVIVSANKLTVVNPSPDQTEMLQDLTSDYLVKDVVNGFSVTAPKDKLYGLLYSFSCEYDVELI